MRDAQAFSVDKLASLFERCDIIIDTDDDGWTLVTANPKARAVVDALVQTPINWHMGRPLHEWLKGAPREWVAADLNFHGLEQDGFLDRLPKIGNADTGSVHPYTLRLGVAAQSAGLRVILHDDKTGCQTINLQKENNVIDFTGALEVITRRRAQSYSSFYPDGTTRSLQSDPSGKLVDQKVTLPGLPGGPPLVPALPLALFETISDCKIGFTEPLAFASKPKPEFPSGLPLFELSPSVCRTLSSDDRAKMIADMIECDCLQLPFRDGIAVRFWLPDVRPGAPEFFVTFACNGKLRLHLLDPSIVVPDGMQAFIEIKSLNGSATMRELNYAASDNYGTLLNTPPAEIRNKGNDDFALDCLDALTTLLISLATRNEVKTTERNTRLKNKHKQSKPQFIGPLGAIYISTTRVEAPAVEDMEQQEREPGSHTSPRPHRRRGHKHTVRYGVGRRESRVQWFPAVWVNGDPAFVADARKYVVTQ